MKRGQLNMNRIIISQKVRAIFLTVLLPTIALSTINAQSSNISIATDSINTTEEAIKLIHSPDPTFKPYQPKEIDPSALADMGFEQVYENIPQRFLMRDGKQLFAYKYPKDSKTTIILLHGVFLNFPMVSCGFLLVNPARSGKYSVVSCMKNRAMESAQHKNYALY